MLRKLSPSFIYDADKHAHSNVFGLGWVSDLSSDSPNLLSIAADIKTAKALEMLSRFMDFPVIEELTTLDVQTATL